MIYIIFKIYKKQFLLYKSDQTIYDTVLLASPAETIVIPPFIKHIESYSFYKTKTKSIEFDSNSNLQSIESYAFHFANIIRICIPHRLKIIKWEAFSFCRNLPVLEIPEDSKLTEIHENAFSCCSIKFFPITKKQAFSVLKKCISCL